MSKFPEEKLSEADINREFLLKHDVAQGVNILAKKGHICQLIRPPGNYETTRVVCNGHMLDIPADYLQEFERIKRYLVFGHLTKGGWNDYIGSFHLWEEAEKAMGLYKVANHKYQVIDSCTGLVVGESK